MGATRGRLRAPDEAPRSGEMTHTLVAGSGFRVEQVLSGVLDSPLAFDQDHDELFAVLAGSARLTVAGETWELTAGDWGLLPAGTEHTLLWTEPGTSWLVVRGESAGSHHG